MSNTPTRDSKEGERVGSELDQEEGGTASMRSKDVGLLYHDNTREEDCVDTKGGDVLR